MKIWCLFSIANDYNQPDHNLECWWSKKPDCEQISKVIGRVYSREEGSPNAGKILKGQEVRVGGADYRLKQVSEGEML